MTTITEIEMMIFGDFVRRYYEEMDGAEWTERYEMYLSWMDYHHPSMRRLTITEFGTQLQHKISNSETKILTATEWLVWRYLHSRNEQ